jgi:hypothetical protein
MKSIKFKRLKIYLFKLKTKIYLKINFFEFKKIHFKISICKTFFYNIPSASSDRYTTLGKGKKFDFSKLNNNKCSEFYEKPSDFNPKKPNAPAYSFGISRNYYKKVFCDTNLDYGKDVPGPGKYETSKVFGNGGPKFSLYGRIKDRINNSIKNPGPGQYESFSINPLGKFHFSNLKNATNIVFGSSKEKRFNYTCKIFFFLLHNKNLRKVFLQLKLF